MSTSLIVLIPVVLLGIVGMLCFVGCILDSSGLPGTPVTNYSDGTVLLNENCMGYWPLSETSDTVKAAELVHGLVGTYIDQNTAIAPLPTPYPWPEFTLQNPPGPDVKSAAAGMGSITLGAPSIVKGDVDKPNDDPALPACMVVNGCFVHIPFDAKFTPTASFTLEAWVRPDWDASVNTTHANRYVLDTRSLDPGKGFALFAQAEDGQPGMYRWAGMIGNGGMSTDGLTPVQTSESTITLSSGGTPVDPVYLALTFDTATLKLTLFVNGEQQGEVDAPNYVPNDTQPLWIGAGAPFAAPRPQPDGVPSSPLFPFVGAIQDVAIYGVALDAVTIRTHFHHGSGTDP
jgi:Concanavalin A-like lectin/glucanases superfamily